MGNARRATRTGLPNQTWSGNVTSHGGPIIQGNVTAGRNINYSYDVGSLANHIAEIEIPTSSDKLKETQTDCEWVGSILQCIDDSRLHEQESRQLRATIFSINSVLQNIETKISQIQSYPYLQDIDLDRNPAFVRDLGSFRERLMTSLTPLEDLKNKIFDAKSRKLIGLAAKRFGLDLTSDGFDHIYADHEERADNNQTSDSVSQAPTRDSAAHWHVERSGLGSLQPRNDDAIGDEVSEHSTDTSDVM